jgi:hypothetical protein
MRSTWITFYSLLVNHYFSSAFALSLLQPLLATAAISERRFGAIDTFDNPQAATSRCRLDAPAFSVG